MPMYEYECGTCGKHEDSPRCVAERDEGPECCGGRMARVFAVRGAVAPNDNPGFQPAFGKTFSSKRQMRDEMRRLRNEHGIDMVEVGDQKMPKREAPKGKPFNGREAYQYLRSLNRGRN